MPNNVAGQQLPVERLCRESLGYYAGLLVFHVSALGVKLITHVYVLFRHHSPSLSLLMSSNEVEVTRFCLKTSSTSLILYHEGNNAWTVHLHAQKHNLFKT